MKLRTLQDAPIKAGMRVLVRTDFDVVVKNGKVEDEFRIKESLPTLRYILSRGANPVIISHRGRPGEKRVKGLSMIPVARRLEKIIGKKVIVVRDPFSDREKNKHYSGDTIILFENIRFWKGEEENNASFACRLAKWGEVYVNDAFASSHRKHASLVLLPKILPSYAGLRLSEEITQLSKILKNPKRPLAAVIGGVKLETKLPLIKRFLVLGAQVLVGGAAANALLAAKGFSVNPALEPSTSHLEECGECPAVNPALAHKSGFRGGVKVAMPLSPSLLTEIKGIIRNPRLHLPRDLRGGNTPCAPLHKINVRVGIAPYLPFDVGPETIRHFSLLLSRARTIVWNGPLGLIEVSKYAKGTLALARNIRKIRAFKVIGGGDTIAILRKHKLLSGFDHVSTGGGAMLEFLAGKRLPGIEALKK